MLSLEKARFPIVTVEILGLLFKLQADKSSLLWRENTISIFQDVHYTNILKDSLKTRAVNALLAETLPDNYCPPNRESSGG